MTDILFGNNNRPVLKLLTKRSLKAQKNTIAVLAIMLATLLFTSLFTIAISLQTAMQESNMRTTGTSAHAGIKRLSWEEYEKLSSDTGIKDIGYSIIIGNAVGDDFNKTPTELRYGDETYAELTFNTPDTGHLPEQKNEIATSRIVLDAMGLPDKVGTQMELTITTDTDTYTDTFMLCGIWDGDAVAYRQTMLLSKSYTEQVAPVIHGETDGTTPPVGNGYIDAVMMMPTAWNIEKQALDVTSKYGLDERVSINDAYGMATVNPSSMLPLVTGVAVIFIAGYLLIYNVFYISIAQDIRFYGMLKTLGTTARQIRKIVYRKAIKLSLMGIPIGLLLGWPIGRLLLPAIVNMLTDDIRIVTTVNPLIFLVAIVFSAITVFISCQKPAILAAKISPMEALHYIEQTGGKKKQRRSKHISTMMMAKNNLTRNKKKVMIVTLSFALSIVLLNSVYTYVNSFDFDKFVADFSLTDFTVSDTTVINNYAPYNTANVSQDFISQAESLNGLEDIGNIYLWTSKQPLSENDLARLQELSASSSDIANELENYRVRQEHGVNVYGLDDFPAEYVQVLDGELNTEQWKAGTGVYVTPLRMMGDGSLCLYKPGDQISVTQLDGTNKVYDVLAVVSIPSALQTPLQVDMGLDYIFPTNELLGNMVSADQPAMKTIFNVDEGIYQCLPLVFQAHIQLAEPEQPEPDELLRDLGLCQLLFCNAGFKLTLGFFQLLQPLLGGTGQDTGLNRIEHILDTGFCIPELLFIKGNVGILLILQFHHLGDDGFHGGIVLDKLHGLVDHKIFQPLFTDSFLLAAFMLFGSSAFIIAVDFARPARTAFAKHQCTTVAAEQLGGEQVVILCLSTGRGFLVFQHLFLYIVEKLCRHNGGNRIGNQNITIFQLPDVAAIVQHMLS